jgi:hypothetical protein
MVKKKEVVTWACTVCGAEYFDERLAQICESSLIEDCPIRPGDTVLCYERYENPVKDQVVAVEIGKPYSVWSYNSWADKGYDTMVREHGRQPRLHHCWVIATKDEHQMSKDDESYTNRLDSGNVIKDGVWVDFQNGQYKPRPIEDYDFRWSPTKS